jgi:hypothetical protein
MAPLKLQKGILTKNGGEMFPSMKIDDPIEVWNSR